MPPRLLTRLKQHGNPKKYIPAGHVLSLRQPTCCFSSLPGSVNRTKSARRPGANAPSLRRFESTVAANPVDAESNARLEPRKELETILLALQKHAASHVNLSRLQLAINGLRQRPGEESIRIAVLGLTDGSEPSNTAKKVLKLLLADPLKGAQAWEQEVEGHDLAEPMLVRIGAEETYEGAAISVTKGNLLREVNVSCPGLNGHNVEVLLADTNPFLPATEGGAPDGFEDTVLVPTVDIPTSNTGRYTPVTVPVHKALVVADGIRGVLSVMSMPTLEDPSILKYTVDIPEYQPADTASLPFTPIDASTAELGLGLIRTSVSNAMEYDHMWFRSNLPQLVEWLKSDILTTPDNVTKPPVRELIASLLRNTLVSVRAEETSRAKLPSFIPDTDASLEPLRNALADWAENAHSELQEQLDLAFSGNRWRKLGWWKLFWRVDDVGMLTNDILAQKFLTEAEKRSIFLAGRMSEAGVYLAAPLGQPDDTIPNSSTAMPSTRAVDWPTSIPNTRTYLQTETVPDLQALAQKLVLQTLSTSGLTTALGALAYVGTLSTSLYEAGAVAALGIVWSMRRMQKQWEKARDFWEGEVREEGRKAVKSSEWTMKSALMESNTQGPSTDDVIVQDDLQKARDLVTRGQELLEELK
ncbi:hypothetical protein F5Y17DRAFT_412206 [Xylariaceae sp. FL0594]|nr:hypothetical protein F5Y17DRAFT_412206 [Xylariaceae sp. FL0594]